MNGLDLFLLTLAGLAALGGYRLGFLARTVSWIGMGIGFFAAVRTLPWIAGQFEGMQPEGMTLVMGLTLILGSFIGQAIGLLIGTRIRIRLPSREWLVADHIMGAVTGLAGVVAALWLLLPTLAHAPGILAEQTRSSTLARTADRLLPDAPDELVDLRRLVGEDFRFPQVFDTTQRAPNVGPPPEDLALSADLQAAVTPSTVKITGIACRRVQEGSGFVTLGRDVVVTNAHVVAGHEQTQVVRSDEVVLDATLVAFDGDRDLAVLRVPGLDREPLAIAENSADHVGGVFGYPGGGPFRIAPFVVGDEVQAQGRDIYDGRRTTRQVLVLASRLAPGDSGGALIDTEGAVVGVAFAIAPDRANVAYALHTSELLAVLSGDLATRVDSGPCLR